MAGHGAFVIFIGQIIYGYCNGEWGRDSFHDKRIEAFGYDWIVAREIGTGKPDFVAFKDHATMLAFVAKNSQAPSE
jgi:hypothetical protein